MNNLIYANENKYLKIRNDEIETLESDIIAFLQNNRSYL